MIAVDQCTLIERFLFYFNLCLGPLNGNSQRLKPRKHITSRFMAILSTAAPLSAVYFLISPSGKRKLVAGVSPSWLNLLNKDTPSRSFHFLQVADSPKRKC